VLFPVVYRQHVSAVMRDPGHLQALEFRSNNQMHQPEIRPLSKSLNKPWTRTEVL
jgi:hypothetical protein